MECPSSKRTAAVSLDSLGDQTSAHLLVAKQAFDDPEPWQVQELWHNGRRSMGDDSVTDPVRGEE